VSGAAGAEAGVDADSEDGRYAAPTSTRRSVRRSIRWPDRDAKGESPESWSAAGSHQRLVVGHVDGRLAAGDRRETRPAIRRAAPRAASAGAAS
jgi:hypothetical protein